MKWTLFRPHSFQLQYSFQKIWALAWPMIIANISVPLLGFVDTSVIGHLPDPAFLAGTALASLVVSILFWLMGFLRMSTTGLIAQAYGEGNALEQRRIVCQGLVLAGFISASILLFQSVIFNGLLALTGQVGSQSTSIQAAESYFDIRIWSAPVSLSNMVLTGCLLGLGKTRLVLISVLTANFINLALDILFVPVLGYGVSGVAAASVIAECCQLLLLLFFVRSHLGYFGFSRVSQYRGLGRLMSLNSNIFIRSAMLQLVLSFITLHAVRYGDEAVAVNAILMQFFLFISFTLDGIAFALEAIVGQQQGKGNHKRVRSFTARGMLLGLYFAVFYSFFYVLTAQGIISLLTSITSLKSALGGYLHWIYLLPLVSYLSFILDGIFVGLAWVTAMRNSMTFAAIVFFITFGLVHPLENHGLWLAFCMFMAARGLSQSWLIKRRLFS